MDADGDYDQQFNRTGVTEMGKRSGVAETKAQVAKMTLESPQPRSTA
jgi:hypothetical protein